MVRPRVVETDNGIQEEITVELYDKMMRRLREGGVGQMHHFVTNKGRIWPARMREITDQFNLDLDGAWNRGFLPDHKGRHADGYHKWVFEKLREAAKYAGNNVDAFIEYFDETVIDKVLNNPGMIGKDWWD